MYRRIMLQQQQAPSLARMRQKQLDVLQVSTPPLIAPQSVQLQQRELEKRMEVLDVWKAVGLKLLDDCSASERVAALMASLTS
jgi:hypothetical protein